MNLLRRLLCRFGRHSWLLIYQDDQEALYSCTRAHGDTLCPALEAVKTNG